MKKCILLVYILEILDTGWLLLQDMKCPEYVIESELHVCSKQVKKIILSRFWYLITCMIF